ncbi:DUF2730 domain-containing protein [Tahibacter soli]|uniref:DUF2730 domain-containing protein n=1 Tax=Tahibacter soli TaxID=2983605 RepID=A0A9X3YLI6_9GAMM|nr:DUF2730 domain-containing protein [Tahibacter soli]MDC8012923.1 DUF2730 domain-containing protein [Tahibacter soli]
MVSLDSLDNVLRSVQIAVLLGSVGVNVWLWVRGRNDKALDALKAKDAELSRQLGDTANTTTTQLVALTANVAALGTRVAVLETTVRHMPTHNDLQAIQRELRDINGTVSAVSERSEATLEMVRTIQAHLLESK